MSETRDKRRRTDLDLFVLALIDSGVSTPYEFQKAAGLSLEPRSRRCKDCWRRFLRQGKPGSRGRTNHSITPAGQEIPEERLAHSHRGWSQRRSRRRSSSGPVGIVGRWQTSVGHGLSSAVGHEEIGIDRIIGSRIGEQFRFFSCELVRPTSVGVCKGLGKSGLGRGIRHGRSFSPEALYQTQSAEALYQAKRMSVMMFQKALRGFRSLGTTTRRLFSFTLLP